MLYDIVITTLSEEDGGGFAGYAPDLEGCMSDGATPQEAFKNTVDAMNDWIAAYQEAGRELPEVGHASKAATEDRGRLVSVIKILSEGIDGKLEELEEKIVGIAERMEQTDDWVRFQSLPGVLNTPSVSAPLPQNIKN